MITLTLYGSVIYRGYNVDYVMRMARKLKSLIEDEWAVDDKYTDEKRQVHIL